MEFMLFYQSVLNSTGNKSASGRFDGHTGVRNPEQP